MPCQRVDENLWFCISSALTFFALPTTIDPRCRKERVIAEKLIERNGWVERFSGWRVNASWSQVLICRDIRCGALSC